MLSHQAENFVHDWVSSTYPLAGSLIIIFPLLSIPLITTKWFLTCATNGVPACNFCLTQLCVHFPFHFALGKPFCISVIPAAFAISMFAIFIAGDVFSTFISESLNGLAAFSTFSAYDKLKKEKQIRK